MSRTIFAVLSVATAALVAGCTRGPTAASNDAPIPVSVAYPIEREVSDYGEYTGRTAAVDSVDVRARAWGYLEKINFKEGAMVTKGDVLFEIDPRPYKAALAQAEGNLAAVQARLKRLDSDLERVKKLPPGSVSSQELDKYNGDRSEAAASLEALQAAVNSAKLDLDYTKVIAPVSGRISRYFITVGNLIQSGGHGQRAADDDRLGRSDVRLLRRR
jgi:RND family efflux transporter MFP subunit